MVNLELFNEPFRMFLNLMASDSLSSIRLDKASRNNFSNVLKFTRVTDGLVTVVNGHTTSNNMIATCARIISRPRSDGQIKTRKSQVGRRIRLITQKSGCSAVLAHALK